MTEDEQELINRLYEEVRHSYYPVEKAAIRNRYKDTALALFRELQDDMRGSFLSFGSRRSSLISSYGNTPTFIRRSLSSNGMIEYSVEQFGSTKWKGSQSLLSNTLEEKDEENEDTHTTLEEKTVEVAVKKEDKTDSDKKYLENFKFVSVPNKSSKDGLGSHCIEDRAQEEDDNDTEIYNRKSFSHYDVPPSRKPSSAYKGESSILETAFDTCSNTGSIIDLKDRQRICVSTGHQVEEIQRVSACLSVATNHVNGSDNSELNNISVIVVPDISTVLSKENENIDSPYERRNLESGDAKDVSIRFPSPEKEPFSERSRSVNEKIGTNQFTRNSHRFSLRNLPRRSPTPPRRRMRKPSKTSKELSPGKAEICTLNINGTNYHGDGVSPSGEINMGQIDSLPPLVPSHADHNEENGVSLKSDGRTLGPPEVGLQTHCNSVTIDTSLPPQLGIQNLANDGNVNKNFIVVHPSSKSNSLGLAPVSPRKKQYSSTSINKSPPSFKRSFNRHRSQSNQQLDSATASRSNNVSSTYLYSKSRDIPSVKLIKFMKSKEDSVSLTDGSSQNSIDPSDRLVTSSLIRSVPYGNFKNGDSNLEFSDSFINANSSRLCSIM